MEDTKALKKAFRKAWILVLLGICYIIFYVLLSLSYNQPGHERTWDADGTPFVPASDVHAEGYYLPADPAFGTGGNKEATK